jgi:hypothetical protein
MVSHLSHETVRARAFAHTLHVEIAQCRLPQGDSLLLLPNCVRDRNGYRPIEGLSAGPWLMPRAV